MAVRDTRSFGPEQRNSQWLYLFLTRGEPIELEAQATIHLVIRIGGDITSTINHHQEVLAERGSVWFAKLGKSLGAHNIERLNEQIQDGTPTSVYFVGKQDGEHRWFKARLAEVRRSKPEDKSLIPPYYPDRHFELAHLWCRLSALDPLDPHVSRRLFIKSSGASAAEAMRSMAAMFIVVERLA